MIAGNLISLVFHGTLENFKERRFKKILKYLIVVFWLLINVIFLLGALIIWLFSLTLSWYLLILCILLPIELMFDLILILCISHSPLPSNDH